MTYFDYEPTTDLKRAYQKATEQTSDICQKHNVAKVKILKTGTVVCPKCHEEAKEAKTEETAQKLYDESVERKRKYFLTKLSIMDDELEAASFDNFRAETAKQKEVLAWARSIANDWYLGGKSNVVMTGRAGRGKSHLAYSIVRGLSDETKKLGLMVNVTDLLAEIKRDFSQEAFWLDKLKEVDYLVLDDLGAEKISDWSNSIIYSLLNKRTNTIITTNLSAVEIKKAYGERITSRILKGCSQDHIMAFDGLEDERIKLWRKH